MSTVTTDPLVERIRALTGGGSPAPQADPLVDRIKRLTGGGTFNNVPPGTVRPSHDEEPQASQADAVYPQPTPSAKSLADYIKPDPRPPIIPGRTMEIERPWSEMRQTYDDPAPPKTMTLAGEGPSVQQPKASGVVRNLGLGALQGIASMSPEMAATQMRHPELALPEPADAVSSIARTAGQTGSQMAIGSAMGGPIATLARGFAFAEPMAASKALDTYAASIKQTGDPRKALAESLAAGGANELIWGMTGNLSKLLGSPEAAQGLIKDGIAKAMTKSAGSAGGAAFLDHLASEVATDTIRNDKDVNYQYVRDTLTDSGRWWGRMGAVVGAAIPGAAMHGLSELKAPGDKATPAPEPLPPPQTPPEPAPKAPEPVVAPAPEAKQGEPDGKGGVQAPEPTKAPEPRNVVALRSRLDQVESEMNDAKRAMEPDGKPKEVGFLAAQFERARNQWQDVFSKYQMALNRAGLPLDTREPPTLTSKAPGLEPTEPPQEPTNGLPPTQTPKPSGEAVPLRDGPAQAPEPGKQADVQAAPAQEAGGRDAPVAADGQAADVLKRARAAANNARANQPEMYAGETLEQTTERMVKIIEKHEPSGTVSDLHTPPGFRKPGTLATAPGSEAIPPAPETDQNGSKRISVSGATEKPVSEPPKADLGLSRRNGATEPPPVTPTVADATPNVAEPDTTGIAHRVSKARGVEAPRGEGINPEESVQRGRTLIKGGSDPEAVAAKFSQDQSISGDSMAVVRAHLETLDKAANAAADKHGPTSSEYKAAYQQVKDWVARIKPMQTEWHKVGQAQQGETEIDTGTFHGLQRAYHETFGKDFTPAQAKTAERTAAKVKKATGAAEEAKQRLYAVVGQPEPEMSPRVKSIADRIVVRLDKAAAESLDWLKKNYSGGTLNAGLDPTALYHLSRYGAAKVAKGAVLFADWSAEMVKDFGEKVRPHLNEVWDATDKYIDGETAKGAGKNDQPAIKAKIGKASADLAGHPPGSTMTPERVKALWEKAKTDYIEKGVTNFDDVVNKLAADTGLPVDDIRRGLAQPKGARAITNEMYAKQSEQRRVVNSAKTWVQNAGASKVGKVAGAVPGVFFSLKTLGHSTVGMITHAGPTLAIAVPGTPKFRAYVRNFIEQYRLVASSAHHEQMMSDLERRPNYITAQRAGLANNVNRFQDEYQQAADKLLGKLGVPAGAKGFDALKLMRQDLFDQAWDRLPVSLQNSEVAKSIANSANHLTGYGANIAGKGALGKAASVMLFSPKLEGSRWGLIAGDPIKAAKTFANWKNEPPEARYAAIAEVKQKAALAGVYMSYLAANQLILSAAGSSQKINFTDPSKADWLSFKVAGHNVGIIGPLLGSIRFITDLARYPFESKKELHGDEPLDKAGGRAIKYLRSKLSPFGQPVADVYTGSDYQKRPMPWSSRPVPAYLRREGLGPITWGEYAVKTLVPIPVEEAITESWKAQGVDDNTAKRWLRALVVGGVSGGTGARITEEHTDPKKK